jgi:Phage terminase, small subunit
LILAGHPDVQGLCLALSPYLPVVNKQAQIMLKAAEQLGFTPTARSRVQITEPISNHHNKWADLG